MRSWHGSFAAPVIWRRDPAHRLDIHGREDGDEERGLSLGTVTQPKSKRNLALVNSARAQDWTPVLMT
jgi:hypothetical protein